jgi:hypothetical protein
MDFNVFIEKEGKMVRNPENLISMSRVVNKPIL